MERILKLNNIYKFHPFLEEVDFYFNYSNIEATINDEQNIDYEDIYYIEYKIEIFKKGEIIFSHENVESLNPVWLYSALEEILSDSITENYYEYKNNKYKFVEVYDFNGFDYSYKIEKSHSVWQGDKYIENYRLSINKEKDYGFGTGIFIENLEEKDIERFKNVMKEMLNCIIKGEN